MAVLLFNLRGVPEDEAYEVRDLLNHHEIDFYETSAGNWGFSLPALWLRDESQLNDAQQLLENYQQYRYTSQREAYLKLKAAGEHKTLFQSFLENPMSFALYLAAMGLVIYISIKVLFEFGL
ncbi:MAG: hypothetical protein GQ569_11310 [Methylococcaceae bacterium]|nr:hypothetical protein [Methylococcaceae bacterium]